MAFKLDHVTVTHTGSGQIIGASISDSDKNAKVSVHIHPEKPYQQLTLGEALDLAIKEANKLTAC